MAAPVTPVALPRLSSLRRLAELAAVTIAADVLVVGAAIAIARAVGG